MTNFRALCWLGGVLLWVGLLSQAHAGNVFIPGNGARAMGKASAVVASGDDAYAVIFNPANLSRLRGFGFRLDGYLSYQSLTFQRAPENDGKIVFDPSVKNTDPLIIPFLGLWYGFGKVGPGDLTISLFGYGPHGRRLRYEEKEGKCEKAKEGDAFVCDPMPEPGAQRLSLVYTNSPLLFFGVGAAYAMKFGGVGVRLGATFKTAYLQVDQKLGLIAGSSKLLYRTSKTITDGEVLMKASADGIYFTGDVGLTVDLPFGFSVGASVYMPATAQLSGTLEIQVGQFFGNQAQIFGKDVGLAVPFPLIFRSGVAWKGHNLTVEAGFFIEFWGSVEPSIDVDATKLKIRALGKDNELGVVKILQPLRNSLSFRFGAEYELLKMFLIRAGFIWESGATELKRLSPGSMDYPDKIGLSGGLSFKIPKIGMMIDFSIVHTLSQQFKITDSEVVPADVSPEGFLRDSTNVKSVTNGTYDYGITIVSMGLRGNWGK